MKRYNYLIFIKACNPPVSLISRDQDHRELGLQLDLLDVHRQQVSKMQSISVMKIFILVLRIKVQLNLVKAWVKFLLIRFQEIKEDTADQKKEQHYSTQPVVLLTLNLEEVYKGKHKSRDTLHRQSTSTRVNQVIKEVAVDLFNKLQKEIQVLNYQVPDLLQWKTCHLILVKMNGVKSRNLARNCTRKRLEKRKRKQCKKLETWEMYLISKWLYGKSCKLKQKMTDKNSIAKYLSKQKQRLNKKQNKKRFNRKRSFMRKRCVNRWS